MHHSFNIDVKLKLLGCTFCRYQYLRVTTRSLCYLFIRAGHNCERFLMLTRHDKVQLVGGMHCLSQNDPRMQTAVKPDKTAVKPEHVQFSSSREWIASYYLDEFEMTPQKE